MDSKVDDQWAHYLRRDEALVVKRHFPQFVDGLRNLIAKVEQEIINDDQYGEYYYDLFCLILASCRKTVEDAMNRKYYWHEIADGWDSGAPLLKDVNLPGRKYQVTNVAAAEGPD